MLTAIEIKLSQQSGILANPILNDGISYLVGAKQLFYKLGQGWFQNPSPLLELFGNRYPLWTTLLLLSQTIFGEGEWQSYAVRFWPSFLFLLLMLWVVRRRSNASIAWAVVLITGLLPIISTSLRAMAYYFFSPAEMVLFGKVPLAWYIADLRPNVFCFVLLLWAIVVLVEQVHCLNRNVLLVSGTFTGLALLGKATYLPMITLMMGLTLLYVGWVNRKQLRSTVLTCCWGLLPFLALTLPWAMIGGFGLTIRYIYWNAIVNAPVWATANPTFLTESTYYWNLFPKWFGLEGWLILVLGLLSFGIVGLKLKRVDHRLTAYLGLAVAYYIFVSISQVKDYFSGSLYYLLMWLFCWLAMLPILVWVSHHSKILPLGFAGLYLVIVLSRGFYASLHWPLEYQVGQQNRAVIQQIGKDLATFTPEDCFVPSDASNSSNIRYYTINKDGSNRGKPLQIMVWIMGTSAPSEPEINEFFNTYVNQCRAVFVHESSLEEAAHYVSMPLLVMPFYQALQKWISRPGSPYQPGPVYSFLFNTCEHRNCTAHRLNIRLYTK
ncbi:hypothetical protein K9N68_20645 [Kovacikia minuta CCNUW1]|uniref:hypothetical protein n=1 Tax=Kovacikia minuta TaxID=2931930 RepID=UPI001CCD0411|nr:hypothetical protein [Kovacikia minuta]UBF24123.1 hypothetical protein K9N68_20645 [Kovacikia minuta CCNUW1]